MAVWPRSIRRRAVAVAPGSGRVTRMVVIGREPDVAVPRPLPGGIYAKMSRGASARSCSPRVMPMRTASVAGPLRLRRRM